MKLLNLLGSPGAGKSTTAAYLYYHLKKTGIRTELVGEAAREHHIYGHDPNSVAPALLDNQVLLTGQQYERILRLKRHGIEVAISDSPLIQSLLYCEGFPYYYSLKNLIRELEKDFETYNVFLHAKEGVYDPESRVQRTEAEARALDYKIRVLVPNIWMELNWGEEEKLISQILEALKKETQ